MKSVTFDVGLADDFRSNGFGKRLSSEPYTAFVRQIRIG
jgi:hypothetical protein